MEFLKTGWDFIQTATISLWSLLEGAGLLAWDSLVVLHVQYPRAEGLIIGIALAWFMTRRDRHPLIKALSAPLKLVIDILDLMWDQSVEFLKDVLGTAFGWIKNCFSWCISKISAAWSWCISGLESIRDKLKKSSE